MKKIFAVILLTASLLTMLVGCRKEPGSGITREEVLDTFESQILGSELADGYNVTRLPETELPDSGDIYRAVVVTDKLLDYSYHLGVYSTASGEVYLANLTHESTGYGYFAFSIFCLYLVNAVGLQDIDPTELSDKLDLASSSPSGSVSVDGWNIMAFTHEDLLTFSATYRPE